MSDETTAATEKAPVLQLQPNKPDPTVVVACEELLKLAQEGRLLGLVVLLNYPTEVHAYSVGEFSRGNVLLGMEYWKRDQLFRD